MERGKQQAIIELKEICKYYMMGEEKLEVLKKVSFRVEPGDYVAILGPSGSGKSTLMNIIGCMDRCDSGEYYLAGESIHSCGERRLAQIRNREIGFIFQRYQLIPRYTVLQNVTMPLLIRGMRHREAEKKCAETIRLLGLDGRLKHHPSELSGGQQQRVAIARALVGEPAVLLADEPTGALDSNTGLEVLQLFQQLNDMGNAIVMITHDLNVAKHAKRVLQLTDGILQAS